ncbi:PAS/PAC sensor signal transduction histidine kinase [uncultured Desulfatiglans sp.]|uniref:histidine kinase n=1 Tax=Uncultured Desulfatiglans sp. TaxID=1748965 RepID=A0A653ABD1_UNCDX|nr:PAS/PAC sensor signal transduction histidine kinase [uncultured Desulfatiglans sp.]
MTKRRRLIWQLYPSYLLITLLAIMASAWFATHLLTGFIFDQALQDLGIRAGMVSPQILQHLDPLNEAAVDQFCKATGRMSTTRLTVLLADGRVIGDSREDPGKMDNHLDRPEIKQAAVTGFGHIQRFSRTTDYHFLYAALPLFKEGRMMGFVRAATPIDHIKETVRKAKVRMVEGGVLTAVLAALLAFLVSRRIVRPVNILREWAEGLSAGDAPSRPPVEKGGTEIASLAEAIYGMAVELRGQILAATQQRNEMEAILASMADGVIALDMDERILTLNAAAGVMLGWTPQDARGRSLQEVARYPGLQRFARDTIDHREPIEQELVLAGNTQRFLKAGSSILRDGEGLQIGVLIVLNDVTRLRQLENVRRDFVANVSHELRTPLTAIKGFVETLKEGALTEPENAQRFLGIIEKHVARLEAIIKDLLSLSRIEKETENGEIRLTRERLLDVIQTAVQVCAEPARLKEIRLSIRCPADLEVGMDPLRLEQAIVNLLDNAIKYSDPGKEVRIDARTTPEGVELRISDQGYGIPKEHLSRIFERFYRVDKARSRQEGGTGLGLAIVKHIVQAHGGRLEVESTPGKGSTFNIVLKEPPLAARTG